mmetsp:Transcript_19276/g.63782  ORF Transcript_19276/g.63782 Transcript_19276/m.63782 type:complete len:196 (-) Transcript_19276:539-1126(-)
MVGVIGPVDSRLKVAEHTAAQKEAVLADTREIGMMMRSAQSARERNVSTFAAFDLAERTRRNHEATRTQTLNIRSLFSSIAAEKISNGITMRHERKKNMETIEALNKAELARLQGLNETVKREQELSAKRLKEKIDLTQRKRTEEYLANRTAQFNEFKKAAMVTSDMQDKAAKIVEELRETFENTRDLERKLRKI